MTDNVSVKLIKQLDPYKVDSQKAPAFFQLHFKDCRSCQGLEYAGEVLRSNNSISWFTLQFWDDYPVQAKSTEGIFHFVAHNPSLNVLEIRILSNKVLGSPDVLGSLDRGFCKLLSAASLNEKIERVALAGQACNHLSRCASSTTIHSLDLTQIPDVEAEAWLINPSIKTLRLEANCDDRKSICLTKILDKMTDSNSNHIQHVHLDDWSWSFPGFLRSSKSSVQSLRFFKIDFRHDESGCSAMDGLILGLLGSPTTTAVSFFDCQIDSRAARKFREELRSNAIPVTTLAFHEDDAIEDHLLQFWSCQQLEAETGIRWPPRNVGSAA